MHRPRPYPIPATQRALVAFSACLFFVCSSAASYAGPVTIADATGHRATLDRLPRRIAVAGKATILVQNAVFLFEEAVDRVVALEDRRQSALKFLPLIDPGIRAKTLFDVNAGPEQIAAVKPDLVLMKNFMASTLGPPLEKLSIPVLYLDLETPEAFFKDIRTLGNVFGNPERAGEILEYFRYRMERVKNLVSVALKDGNGTRPGVLLLEYSAQGRKISFGAPPPSWMQTRLVRLAGGRPVWENISVGRGWSIVTVEQIAAWNPEQIFLVDYHGRAGEAVAAVRADPLWKHLRAVKNGQVYAFPRAFYSWDQPGTRWILGLEWLACRIHPQISGHIDMPGEVASFYSILYRLPEQTIRSTIFPELSGHSFSGSF